MASVHSDLVLSEAAYGCGMCQDGLSSLLLCLIANRHQEHLAATLSKDETTAGQFKESLLKTHNVLGHQPGGVSLGKLRNSHSQTAGLLRPTYVCVRCLETFANGDRETHAEKTGHQFCG